jgi:hypothetical protein
MEEHFIAREIKFDFFKKSSKISLFSNFEPLRHRLVRYIIKVVCCNYPTYIFVYGKIKPLASYSIDLDKAY